MNSIRAAEEQKVSGPFHHQLPFGSTKASLDHNTWAEN